MSEAFYRDVCDATLKPVLNALVAAKSMGVLVEVTNLLIPGLNDTDDEIAALCRWVAENLGRETPLHFSRFFPQYRMRHLPPTPADTLKRARDIALAAGLKNIYVGNILVPGAGDTVCPSCRKTLAVRRTGYKILGNAIVEGRCPRCGAEIYGIWK